MTGRDEGLLGFHPVGLERLEVDTDDAIVCGDNEPGGLCLPGHLGDGLTKRRRGQSSLGDAERVTVVV